MPGIAQTSTTLSEEEIHKEVVATLEVYRNARRRVAEMLNKVGPSLSNDNELNSCLRSLASAYCYDEDIRWELDYLRRRLEEIRAARIKSSPFGKLADLFTAGERSRK